MSSSKTIWIDLSGVVSHFKADTFLLCLVREEGSEVLGIKRHLDDINSLWKFL